MLRPLLLAVVVAAELNPNCGGMSSPTITAGQNTQTVVVNAGPANNGFNELFTSVTICVPGQSTCQTIDGVLVDTGSEGLRVLSSALTLSLPQQTDGSGQPVATCGQFLDGFTWGPVQTADIKLGGEQASAVPIQVIGASGFANIPDACSSTGPAENTLATLGANGILGVGLFRQDCGPACTFVGAANPGFYFTCPPAGCQTAAQPIGRQLQNPVWLFPVDNNGMVIQLPSVPDAGAASLSGIMAFGIGTQSNNALGPATVLTVDNDGTITTTFGGTSYGGSFIDSGSNGIFFLDSPTAHIPLCTDSSDFYCPSSPQSLSASLRGVNGNVAAATFAVGNVDTVNQQFTAFAGAAGPNPGGFDWGLAFFFGRTIFTAIEGQATSAGTGPYFAY